MKKLLLLVISFIFAASTVSAFLNEVAVLSKEEVVKLSNERLVEVYIDAKIEIDASKTFHTRAGFNSPKEYDKYKELLAFIVVLRQEMKKRDLEAPPVDEWLR
ncbi:MAG: hypothetical protein H6755_04030 [Candidatus Omnitrophica bacterium]|nr:hypothetical protein [Candidatus Omnitrophota bacterium]MCB9747558.1 hypothetical protein [Candidatus Omnitrophota bacterium]